MNPSKSKDLWNSSYVRFVEENSFLFDFSSPHDVARTIHISTQNKFLYVDIPKNASSSLKLGLLRLEYSDNSYNATTFSDLHDRNYSPLLTPFQVSNLRQIITDANYFIFAVWRDPIERLLSCYLDQVVANKKWVFEIFKNIGLNYDMSDLAVPIPSFEEFIYWILGLSITQMDHHFRPQYYQCFQPHLNQIRLYSIENLEILQKDLNDHINFQRKKNNTNFIIPRFSPHKVEFEAKKELYKNMSYDLRRHISIKYKVDYDLLRVGAPPPEK